MGDHFLQTITLTTVTKSTPLKIYKINYSRARLLNKKQLTHDQAQRLMKNTSAKTAEQFFALLNTHAQKLAMHSCMNRWNKTKALKYEIAHGDSPWDGCPCIIR